MWTMPSEWRVMGSLWGFTSGKFSPGNFCSGAMWTMPPKREASHMSFLKISRQLKHRNLCKRFLLKLHGMIWHWPQNCDIKKWLTIMLASFLLFAKGILSRFHRTQHLNSKIDLWKDGFLLHLCNFSVLIQLTFCENSTALTWSSGETSRYVDKICSCNDDIQSRIFSDKIVHFCTYLGERERSNDDLLAERMCGNGQPAWYQGR